MLLRVLLGLTLCILICSCKDQAAEDAKIHELVEKERALVPPFPSNVDSSLATGEFKTKEEDSILIYSAPKGVPVKKCTHFHILTGNSKYEMPLGIWSTRTWLGGGEYVDTTYSILSDFKTPDKVFWHYPDGKLKFSYGDGYGPQTLMYVYDENDSIVQKLPFSDFDKDGKPFVKNMDEVRSERITFAYDPKTHKVTKTEYYADGSGPAHIMYEVDKQNRVIKKISNYGDKDGKDYVDEYKWRSDGQLESFTKGARFVQFIYDKNGRLLKQQESGVHTDYYYNAKGKLKAFLEYSSALGTTGINMLNYTYMAPAEKQKR